MLLSRTLTSAFVITCLIALTGCVQDAATTAAGTAGLNTYPNPITGEGIPNPNPNRVGSWANLPQDREWGASAGIDIDPIDGHVWAYERCGSVTAGGAGVNCDNNPVDPIFKFDRHTGDVITSFGAGVFVSPHGIHLDSEGNVWVTDFAANAEGTKGHQAHKFSQSGELLMSLGVAGQAGSEPGYLNQPNDVAIAPDGSIFVADGHAGQNLVTPQDLAEGRAAGLTARIIKFTPAGDYIMEWGELGFEHGQFRTPHALTFDSRGRLWVADRGNHRLEIFDQQGNYLESRFMYGRISDIFITPDEKVYAIDSESHPFRLMNWSNGVRIGHVDRDWIEGFIPPWEASNPARPQGVAGEGVAVDADGNVYAAEGPASRGDAGSPFTKYEVSR